MCAALVGGERVNFIDDDRARRLQHGPAGLRPEKDVERLRGCNDDVRGATRHPATLTRRRVAGAHKGADFDVGKALSHQLGANTSKRCREIAFDVVGKRLEWRDVDDLCLILKSPLEALAHQGINGGKKRRQRLAATRGRRDQDMSASLNGRPRFGLRRRRPCKGLTKPPGNCRVEGTLRRHVRFGQA